MTINGNCFILSTHFCFNLVNTDFALNPSNFVIKEVVVYTDIPCSLKIILLGIL